jgi:predicted ATPase
LKEIITGPDVKKILNRFGSDSGLYDDINIHDLSEDLFEVQVFIKGVARNITNVGYGVSQVLPIIIETIARQNETWFAMQQPEVHLHPRAQAALGDFLYKSNLKEGQKFIIETHSDYTIDRYRLRLNRALREGQSKGEANGQVVFFDKDEKGNHLAVIQIQPDGSYPDDQPKEFRDFFIKEQLDLITI